MERSVDQGSCSVPSLSVGSCNIFVCPTSFSFFSWSQCPPSSGELHVVLLGLPFTLACPPGDSDGCVPSQSELCIALLGYSLGMSTWSKLSQSQCFLKMNMDARGEKLLFLGGINSLDRGKPFRCCGPESSICWGRERGDREGATKGPAVWPPGSPAFQSWFSLAGPRKQILISSWRRSAALPPKVQKDEKVGTLNFLAILGPPTSFKSPRPLTLSGTQVTTPQSTESRSVQ